MTSIEVEFWDSTLFTVFTLNLCTSLDGRSSLDSVKFSDCRCSLSVFVNSHNWCWFDVIRIRLVPRYSTTDHPNCDLVVVTGTVYHGNVQPLTYGLHIAYSA